MKKLINISDNLYERLEALQEKFNVKSMQPIVDIVMTIGLAHFEQFASGTVIINYDWANWNNQPYWFQWQPQYNTGLTPDGDFTFKYGDWTLSYNNASGQSNVEYKST